MSEKNNISISAVKNGFDFDNLLGWDAQKGMAPASRLPIERYKTNLKNARVAAVIILLYEEEDQLKFPLILRNVYEGVHSNQIGLPGGKVEDIDINLADTAKRECEEEIGANKKQIEILGQLSEMYIPPSNFMVYPFVGYYQGQPNFVPCDIEVQQIVPVNLDEFIEYKKESFIVKGSNGSSQEVPVYVLENNLKLWGATAMMLNEFKLFVRKSLNL